MSLLRLVQLPQVMDIDTVISQVHELEQRISGGGPSAAEIYPSEEDLGEQEVSSDYSPTEEAESAEATTIAEPVGARWDDCIERVRQEKPALAASLERVSVSEPQPDCLELDFNGHEFDYEMVKERESFGLLSRLAREIFGARVKVTLKVGSEEIRREQRLKTDRQRLQQQKALKHPLVTEALEIFGGEIIEVKVGPEKGK